MKRIIPVLFVLLCSSLVAACATDLESEHPLDSNSVSTSEPSLSSEEIDASIGLKGEDSVTPYACFNTQCQNSQQCVLWCNEGSARCTSNAWTGYQRRCFMP